MQSLFRHVYCLSISDITIFIFVGTFLYLFLCRKCCPKKQKYIISTILFCAWIVVILFATILNRTADTEAIKPVLMPFYSYYVVFTGGEQELLRSNFMNVILFYPAGLLACELFPKTWKRCWKILLVAIVFALLSAGIEVCQYHFALGQAETDDVIHNALGAWIGAAVCTLHISKRQ